MKKLFTAFSFSLLFVSCSGGGGKSFDSVDLSPSELKAKSLIQNEVGILSNPQYGITDKDLALLSQEGLVSDGEKKSLKITK